MEIVEGIYRADEASGNMAHSNASAAVKEFAESKSTR